MSDRARGDALQSLVGILEGLAIDQVISEEEISGLARWLVEHSDVLTGPPFTAVAQRVERALAAKCLTAADNEELLEFVEWFRDAHVADEETGRAAFVRLGGVCKGLMADKRLTEQEIVDLREWLEDFEGLRKVGVFGELFRVLDGALADGEIDETERAEIQAFVSQVGEAG